MEASLIILIVLAVIAVAFSQATTYGTQTINTLGRDVSPFAGVPDYKHGGVTVDWSVVSALNADTTDAVSGRVYKSGDKYIAAGTVLCRVTSNGKWAPYDVGNSPAGIGVLTPGDCFIVVHDMAYSDPGSDHVVVADGGRAWYDRIVAVSTNPTGSTLRAAFPRIAWINTAG